MGEIIDFKIARDEKEYQRKEEKVNKLRSSLKTSRESSETKPQTAEKLKKLFRNKSPEKPSRKSK